MFVRLATVILRRRLAVALAGVVIALCCLVQLPQLGFDFTPQQIFLSASGAQEYREVFAERFGREDNLIVVLVRTDDPYDVAFLGELREATRALRAVEAVESAESIITIDVPRNVDGALSISPPIAPSEEINAEGARALRAAVEAQPLINDRFISTAAGLVPIAARLETDVQSVVEIEAAIDDMRATMSKRQWQASYELAGIPTIRTRIVADLKQDQLKFIPIMGLLYALLLGALFRRPAGVVLPLATVGYALLCLLGLMAATGAHINIINNVLPSLIFVIAASDSIHMLQRDAEASELGAVSREESVVAMMRHTGAACLLTSVTTAIGFFSLITADTQLLREFSWQAGVGVLFAFAVTVTLLPTLLPSLRPVRRRVRDTPDEPFERLGRFVLARPRAMLLFGALLAAGSVAAASQVKVDAFLFDVFGDPPPVRVATSEVEEHLGGVLPIEISLEGPPGAFADPDRYASVAAVQRLAAAQPGVLSTQSYVDYHQAARALLLSDPSQRDVMPDTREQVQQLQMLLAPGPDELEGVRRFVDDEMRYARLLVRVEDAGGRAQLALAERLEAELERRFGEDPDVSYRLTGDAYVASVALESLVGELGGSLLLAFVVIFGVLTLVFRSLKLGLISIVPNALPLLIAAGYMGLAGIPLDLTTTTTFAIGLGLAVDDTIHFVARFREEQAQGKSTHEALLATYGGAGRAIVFTSALLFFGIGVLLVSSFAPTQTFATLMMLTVSAAVVADLVVLPPLLLLVYGNR